MKQRDDDKRNNIYLSHKTFNDLSNNTNKLINILNHRMTNLEQEVMWIKKIGYYMATLLTAIVVKFVCFD